MNQREAEEYRRVKDALKNKFQSERTGEQLQYLSQTKLFQPLIETQKGIQDKFDSSQNKLRDLLIPLTNELQAFHNVPLEIEDVPQSTPKHKDVFAYDLDRFLDDSDRMNLVDMSLRLPSEVMEYQNYDDVLDKIKMLNRQYGQLTGKKSKQDEKLKEIYTSRKTTLEKYKTSLLEQRPAGKYKSGEGLRKRSLYKLKRGRGRPKQYPDIQYYNSADDLVKELSHLVVAKNSGNTGVNNSINSVLDELLKIGVVNKDNYNILYKNIFK